MGLVILRLLFQLLSSRASFANVISDQTQVRAMRISPVVFCYRSDSIMQLANAGTEISISALRGLHYSPRIMFIKEDESRIAY